MIAVLSEAAEKAANASFGKTSVRIELRPAGPVVIGRIASDYVGFTHEVIVPWHQIDMCPDMLCCAVEKVADVLDLRASEIVTIRVSAREPSGGIVTQGNLISRGDWPVIGMSLAAIAICIPLGGGLF